MSEQNLGDPSDTDIELLTAPLDEDDDVLTLVDQQSPDDDDDEDDEDPT